jgi:DDHD domain
MNHLAFSMNEIVAKFRQRNPNFRGGISVISASFEALFVFDLLFTNLTTNVSNFWKLNFQFSKFFACGLPLSLLSIRNDDKMTQANQLFKDKKFFNILHPNDTLSQRIEPLFSPHYAAMPEKTENLSSSDRIDFILPHEATLEFFKSNIYFSSEILMRSITNEIYGANRMDSGSL